MQALHNLIIVVVRIVLRARLCVIRLLILLLYPLENLRFLNLAEPMEGLLLYEHLIEMSRVGSVLQGLAVVRIRSLVGVLNLLGGIVFVVQHSFLGLVNLQVPVVHFDAA